MTSTPFQASRRQILSAACATATGGNCVARSAVLSTVSVAGALEGKEAACDDSGGE